jgi:ComF family protein
MTIKGGIKNYAFYLRNFLFDLFFPLECIGCQAPDTWLCPKCFRALPINNRSYCPACSKKNQHSNYCQKCSSDYWLDGIWTASDYNNAVIAELIKKYKYNFAKNLNTLLGQLLIIYFTQLLESYHFRLGSDENIDINISKQISTPLPILWLSNTIVVSVPLHKKRLQWRGFNQAELIANIFCRHFGLKLKSSLLIRKRYTKPQMRLKKEKRLKNLLSAFAYNGENLKHRPVILIDDVATTGSTLNECAKVLKQNGASEVWGLVVAHG